jgi:glycosyltransferase involved in cell wall biosynthesis
MQPSFTNKVGIVLPTVNRPILLERALGFILNQTMKDWCLAIGNDGGNSQEIADLVDILRQKYGCTNEIVIFDTPSRTGKAATCNRILSLLNTRFVIIMNDDDLWASEFLLAATGQLEYQLRRNSDTKGIIALANIVHEEMIDDYPYVGWTVSPSRSELDPVNNFVHLQAIARENLFSSSQFLFCREAIETIGGLNEDLLILEDWDFHIRFCCAYNIFIIAQPLVSVHRRFSACDSAYQNLLTLHANKTQFFSDRITDQLLREKNLSGNTALRSQLQAILFLRLNDRYNSPNQLLSEFQDLRTRLEEQARILGDQNRLLDEQTQKLDAQTQKLNKQTRKLDAQTQKIKRLTKASGQPGTGHAFKIIKPKLNDRGNP